MPVLFHSCLCGRFAAEGLINMKIVEIKNLCKSYGEVNVLKNINLDIEKGEFISLLGPSGCGKTTMLRILAGLTESSSGDVFINGVEMNGIPAYKRSNGLVFQNYALFPHLTVFQNIEYGLKMHKVSKIDRIGKVKHALELVHLENLGQRYPRELSGGQQQRVALARALVLNPTLLLLDEPLSNLDATLRKEMQIEIRNLQRELNVTTIFVTHDQEEALIMSDRIAVMHDGIIEQIGTPQELYDRPKTQFVASFIGVTNIFKATVLQVLANAMIVAFEDKELVISKEGDPETGEEINFFVRPESVKIMKTPKDRQSIEAEIISKIYLGSEMRFTCKTKNSTEILATVQNQIGYVDMNVGDNVFLSWRVSSARSICIE